jgi:hypothetical protein
MKHVDIGHWADLVRGLACEKKRAEMERHLASGCHKCRRTVQILREAAALASADAGYEVPPYAVHSAKAIFALQRPEEVRLLPRIIGRLVYDSFKEPLPAGFRARHRLTRHALYEAADYLLDLRLEYQPGTTKVNLVGQIAHQKQPDRPTMNLPVYLLSGRKIVAQTLSNAFGEFQIEYEPEKHIRLYLQPHPVLRKNIEIPLGTLSERDDCVAQAGTRHPEKARRRKK